MFWLGPGRFHYKMLFLLPFSKTGPWLQRIADLMAGGRVKVNLDAVFPLDEAA
jgi:NADPH:quinone reductase-like Zn-dependent oxidoreductase